MSVSGQMPDMPGVSDVRNPVERTRSAGILLFSVAVVKPGLTITQLYFN